jgi:ferrous iron transport protein B
VTVNIHTVALIGNPNTGKTSLFNQLTGSNQHVGNWPGVTVERKEGLLHHNEIAVKIIDLPGIYSIGSTDDSPSASSPDERLAASYLANESPEVVLALLDASHLERSLYLTMQLLERGLPVVIALNMMDIATGRGLIIDVKKLVEELSVPIVQIVAREGKGLDKLKDEILKCAALGARKRRKTDLITFEGDEFEIIEKRWNYVGELVARVVTLAPFHREVRNFSDILDRIVTNRYLGLPIFALIMWLMFKLTYTIGDPAADYVRKFWRSIGAMSGDFLSSLGAPYLLCSFIEEALFGGVGAVIVFFPHIFILFAFISLLEDCGYMARGAFVMDRIMHLLGLHGKSFIPMLLGFGCNVPSIIASRILSRTRDRMLTLLIIPFMSCSARLPVFVLFAAAFFGENAPTVIFSLYIIGIIVAICSAKLLGYFFFNTSSSHLIMELPPYLLPRVREVFYHAWERSFDFIKRAGTFILVSMILIWGLASLPPGVEYASRDSFAGKLGSLLTPVFSPAGFDSWQASVALLFGFFAKEIVIGTLGTLLGSADLQAALHTLFSPASAYAFIIMTLLYVPCIATLAAFQKETCNWRWTLFLTVYTTTIAWIFAVIVFQAARLLGLA